MKKDLSKPIFIGLVYAACLALFLIMTTTRLGAVKLAELTAGYGMFDAHIYYSSSKFYEILTMLGADGRAHYLQTHLFDYAFLTLFVVVQFTALYYFYNKLSLSTKCSWIFIPIIGQFFADIVENVTIDILIRWTYPVQNAALVRFASAMTILKYIFLAAWLIIIITLAIKYFVKRYKKETVEA
ncbi:MAG: hypothetical protein EOM87_01885 [Clostridia bacterium]|nr:hypothetical protein [Clostridia bacterium]